MALGQRHSLLGTVLVTTQLHFTPMRTHMKHPRSPYSSYSPRSPHSTPPRISERRSRTDQRASLPGLAAVAGREPVLRVAAVAASAVGLAQSAQLGVSSRKSRTVRSWRDTAGRRVLGVCRCLVWGGGYAVVIGLRVGDAVGAGRTTNTSPGPRVRVIE